MVIARKTFSIKRKNALKRSKLTSKRLSTRIPPSLLKKVDTAFSIKIRARDKHCLYPNCQSTKSLQCSHYYGRVIKNTRFDPENCITLCWFHHFKSKDLGFEYQKQRKENKAHGYDGRYTIFMKEWLGPTRFKLLEKRSIISLKLSREFLTQLLEELTT